jgi:hypothetical protein
LGRLPLADCVAAGCFSLQGLGTVEHPINQVLNFGLCSSTFAHEIVQWNFPFGCPLSLVFGFMPNMQSAVVLLNKVPPAIALLDVWLAITFVFMTRAAPALR